MAEPTPEELKKAYRRFFKESPEGERFMEQLNQMIAAEHQKAEDDGETARDHTQRAKGIREVIGKINTMTAGAKKGQTVQ